MMKNPKVIFQITFEPISCNSFKNLKPLQQKRIKYVGINLPKETKDLYAENYKTLMKER